MYPIRIEKSRPRTNWQQRVEESGLIWHGAHADSYWNEFEHIVMPLAAAECLEDAANELHAMCKHACSEIVRQEWWDRLSIPAHVIPQVRESWNEQAFSLYGRFDLAWDGIGTPKLLEYNADTPTSLLEASIIQWEWLTDNYPNCDQLNSIHETLVAQWQTIPDSTVHFACSWESLEDRQTIAYLAETAEQAGKTVELLDMSEIGVHPDGYFTDLSETKIQRLFKLYPWEWLAQEPFFPNIAQSGCQFTEPAWKMMLSNKAILAILWDLYPNHPLLLPCTHTKEDLFALGVSEWVQKPIFGREGSGITIMDRNLPIAQGPSNPDICPSVFQKRTTLFSNYFNHFVWGLWMVGDTCCGLSARGDQSLITGNTSRFFPHRIQD